MESGGLAILDIVLIAVVLLSGLLALLRGFVHEVLSFGAWIAAGLVALYAFPYVQPHARELISMQVIADVGAGVVLFLVALVVFTLIARAIAAGVHKSGLSALDRTLRDAHRFGFGSLSKMKDEADKYLAVALEIVGRFPDVAGL